ncbi:MAG: DUF4364 family protein [Lachnospiraceae bacterium]|nr:DUF4364 family protein [Lachnospiraceae bacterium]
MSESNLIYKITALDLLSKADFPLSNQQITGFFIEGNYTDYFSIQQILNDLVDTKMVQMDQGANESQYTITSEGLDTLNLFRERITDAIEEEVKAFFTQNGLEMKKENSVTSDYYPSASGGFYVHLRMSETERNVMDLTFHVNSEPQAEAICMNWKQHYSDVYAIMLENLM